MATPVFADGYSVIVNPANGASFTKDDLENLYLAKTKTFPSGELAIPLNQKDSSPIRVAFDSSVVGKSDAQMKSYWAKLVFTGKAVPIKQMVSDEEVIELVSKNPSAIGYVETSKVTGAVKVVLSF